MLVMFEKIEPWVFLRKSVRREFPGIGSGINKNPCFFPANMFAAGDMGAALPGWSWDRESEVFWIFRFCRKNFAQFKC